MQESCTIYFCPLRKKSGRKSHTFQVPNFPKLEESTLKTQHSWAIHPSLHRQPLHSFRQATELRMFQPTSRGFRRSKKASLKFLLGGRLQIQQNQLVSPLPVPTGCQKGDVFSTIYQSYPALGKVGNRQTGTFPILPSPLFFGGASCQFLGQGRCVCDKIMSFQAQVRHFPDSFKKTPNKRLSNDRKTNIHHPTNPLHQKKNTYPTYPGSYHIHHITLHQNQLQVTFRSTQ